MRRFRYFVIQALSLVLIVSTLSVISVVAPPAAKALSNTDCAPTVSGITATAVASGNDCIITFTSGSGTWTTPQGVTTYRLLLIGGGGAGGGGIGGGGGAGEFYEVSSTSLTQNSNVTVTIGSGGATRSGQSGLAGNNTILGSLTAYGGGGGGTNEVSGPTPSQGSGIYL
jgi:hypothetical protein